jgi:hypothetical protein
MRAPDAIQAAIAACHARAASPDDTDWARIVALYGELAQVAPSPVVELNRAVAVGMASGPAAGLELVDQLREQPALGTYHLLPTSEAICLSNLVASKKRARSSRGQHRPRATQANVTCYSRGPGLAAMNSTTDRSPASEPIRISARSTSAARKPTSPTIPAAARASYSVSA